MSADPVSLPINILNAMGGAVRGTGLHELSISELSCLLLKKYKVSGELLGQRTDKKINRREREREREKDGGREGE